MPQEAPQEQWKHAVAGCTAGLTTVLALHPLDVIKTRLQVQDGVKGALPLYRGAVDALRSIVREEGRRALYAGLTPALVGSGAAWGAYFFSYDRAKKRYTRQQSGRAAPGAQAERLGPAMHLAAAAEAGAVVCLLTNPIWVAKTRLQLQRAAVGPAGAVVGPACGAEYSGFVDCLVKVARCEGVRGLYKGLLPSLLLVSHGAIQLAVYEELKSLARKIDLGGEGRAAAAASSGKPGGRRQGRGAAAAAAPARSLTPAEVSVCGALSKLAASVATYPTQVIRSRLQQRMDGRAAGLRYSGVVDVVRKTLAREGVGGLYKGLVPNVVRVMPQAALTFLVYESVMRHLSSSSSSIQPAAKDKK